MRECDSGQWDSRGGIAVNEIVVNKVAISGIVVNWIIVRLVGCRNISLPLEKIVEFKFVARGMSCVLPTTCFDIYIYRS